MPDLNFRVDGVEAVPYAADPLLTFQLLVTNSQAEAIHAVALRCQVRIECARRVYNEREETRLFDLFGERSRWTRTLRSMLWTHANVTVPSFSGSVATDLPVPCTFDFNIAASRYFDGLDSGEAPLTFLFSGTVFYSAADGTVQVNQISTSKEASYPFPVKVWKELMEMYYPNSAWLCLRKDVFDRLHDYKKRQGIPTWEQTVESMLP